jgi:hypothetical protein
MLGVAEHAEPFVCANANDPLRPHENVRAALGSDELRVVTSLDGVGIDEVSGPSALQRSIDLNVDYLR